MDLGTVFKLSLYGLTALVGAILGAAEGEGAAAATRNSDLVLPFLSLPIVVCGYLVTERRRRGSSDQGMGLSSLWANVLGVIALVATFYEFSSENREGKLLAGTHLLLYATWIVLFQKKTVRLYWFLMALGILQLAVASVLTSKGWFGFCAVGYMFCAVWTLSIFSLWRAERVFALDEQESVADNERDEDLLFAGSLDIDQSNSEVRSAVQHEDGTRWLTARFVTGVLMTTCSALVVSSAFFAFIPRVWVGAEMSFRDEQDAVTGLGRKTGLSSSVHLGDLGPVLESMERVFEIHLQNRKTKRVMTAQEYAENLGLAEPLFRGAVLTAYDSGRWNADQHTSFLTRSFERTLKDADVRQEIRLEPITNDVLFCLGTPITMIDSRHHPFGELNEASSIASRGEQRADDGLLEYTVLSMLPAKQQMNFRQDVSPVMRDVYKKTKYLERNLALPTSGLSELKDLTRQILEREKVRRQKAEGRSTPRSLTRLEVADALESYLRDSGEFTYSLDLSVVDPKRDPVEDFLFNRKKGHCEYFASTLALMLRAAKIPARIVSGYKGGVPHPVKKGVLEVQQRFAHLWVEAWVDDEGWTTFDPTPQEARSLSIAAVSAKKTTLWAGMQNTLSGLWSENVLNMNLDRQEESIYKPIRELAYSLMKFGQELFTSPESAFQTIWKMLTNGEQWFSIGGGLFAFTIILVLAGFAWLARRLVRWLRVWLAILAARRNRPRSRVVEFYERFVKLMQAKGLQRSATQTQHEFAEQVASAYSPELTAKDLEATPAEISQLFYRVRFGDEDLSTGEVERLEGLLSRLEDALSPQATQT